MSKFKSNSGITIFQPWYFPFTKNFWCGHSSWNYSDEKYSNEDPDHFEDDPPNLNCGIRIMNLRKLYARKKVAVQGLSINMFDDQITVLLGHNGAGELMYIFEFSNLLNEKFFNKRQNNNYVNVDWNDGSHVRLSNYKWARYSTRH